LTYLAINEVTARTVGESLLAAAPAEAGMFALLARVERGSSSRLALGSPLPDVELRQQTVGRVEPTGRMISAAVSAANEAGCGLAFIHTHPGDTRTPQLSSTDRKTTLRLGVAFDELIDGPFASLVVSPGGWGGAVFEDGVITPFDRLATVGRRLRIFDSQLAPKRSELDDRQQSLLGSAGNRLLRSLRIAIIGIGGTGSPIAETLVRMGIGELILVDPDRLEGSNARRVFGVTRTDALAGKAKVSAVAGGLRRLDLGTGITTIEGDVRDGAVQAMLLGCDMIIGATDNHVSRASMTELAARTHLPLIDIGVRAGTRRDGELDSLYAERRLQIPEGPCLWCWRVLDADLVRLELMSPFERDALQAEGYVAGRPGEPEPTIAALTVTAAGLASATVLGLIGGGLETSPLRAGLEALNVESVAYAGERDPECVCGRWRPA
jgi:hypothetical protein